jgi:UDP-2-acetamido-3-amino-2,3-dideoxy-glucuronate N-acetyltransferase
MSEFGHRLEFNAEGKAICPESQQEYKLENGFVVRM